MDLVKINDVISYVRTGFKGKRFTNNPSPFTPAQLAKDILNKVPDVSGKIAVFFTVEFAVELRIRSASDVTIITDQHCPETKVITDYLGYKYMLLQDVEENDMKFDVVVGNPPYNGKAALHQQFFNKGYDVLKNDGTIVFIQPATTYFNKKDKQKDAVNDMISIIKNNICNVYIANPEVFGNAGIQNDLSITVLTKTPSTTKTIEKIMFKNGNTYNNVPLNDITMTQIDPVVYGAIRTKYEAFVTLNGNLEDKISKEVGSLKATLGKIRGTRPTDDDFYTFIPLRCNRSNYGPSIDSDFGVAVQTTKEVDFVYDYLESYVARFGLAMLKFSQNTANKEFALVPLVTFDQYYTDDDLYSMLGLTTNEIAEIKKVIVPLYDR